MSNGASVNAMLHVWMHQVEDMEDYEYFSVALDQPCFT